jgi:hypothetical protein
MTTNHDRLRVQFRVDADLRVEPQRSVAGHRLRVMRGAQRRELVERSACTAAGPFKCSSCPAAGDQPCLLRGPLPAIDESVYDSDAGDLARWAAWEQRELVDMWRRVQRPQLRRRELVAGAIAGVAGVVVGLVLIVVGLGVLP